MPKRQVTRRSRRVARRRRRIAITVSVTVVAIFGVLAGWLLFRGLQAKSELEATVAASKRLTTAVAAGDFDAAATATSALERHSAAAASAASDPVWRLGELVPAVGANLTAVRVASDQVHSLAVDVAQPLLALSTSLVAGDGDGALLDVEALAGGTPALSTAEAALTRATVALADLDTSTLIGPVSDGVGQLSDVVAQARPAVTALTDASRVVPAMLGGDGKRTILVMLQNSAEVRTGGGITGTFIQIDADHGRLKIIAQADSADFRRRSSDIVPIPASTTALYGDVVGRFVQDTSITPDFDLTARLASAWWHARTGVTPDSVVSVDPLVLQAVLRATGPVKTAVGTVGADDMIQKLLVDPYLTLSQDAQTTVFEDTATAVFAKLTRGGVDAVALASSLAAPASQGRISVWSAHEDEQAVLGGSDLAGPAARQRQAGRQAYAVYFNDITGGKMGTFLDVAIASGTASCRTDGKRTVEVSVTLTSTAPEDAGEKFPANMTGGGSYGVTPGHIGTTISVSAPRGAFYGGVRVDGALVGAIDREDAGFQVSATPIDLAPGQSKTVSFRFDTAATTDLDPTILHTPLIEEPALSASTPACG